jgi:hypothetical protein
MTPAAQIVADLAAEQRLALAFASAAKAQHARLEDLSGRLTHTAPDAPAFRELLGEILLAETAVRYLPDCINRSGYRLERLRTAAAAMK